MAKMKFQFTTCSEKRGWRAGLAALAALVLAQVSSAAIFTVTNVNDAGLGSLRWAIDQANGAAGADEIRFNISGAGPHVIQLDSQLPHVDGDGTQIRGETQPGYVGQPLVALNGARFGLAAFTNYRGNGLVLFGNNCVVRGLAFGGFRPQLGQTGVNIGWREYEEEHSCAVRVHGTNAVIDGCYFGCDTTGTSLRQSGLDAGCTTGVLTKGIGCRVSSSVFALTNRGGVWLYNDQESIVQNNTFGLMADGSTSAKSLPSIYTREFLWCGIVGNHTEGPIIQENRFATLDFGIFVERHIYTGLISRDVTIAANTFGIAFSGAALPIRMAILAKHVDGLEIGAFGGASRPNYIGSCTVAATTGNAGRVINLGAIEVSNATNVRIANNVLGENNLREARPNAGGGIRVFADRTQPMATSVVIEDNRITNCKKGIITDTADYPAGTVSVFARRNVFSALSEIAIDNKDDGSTPPDLDDADTGPSGVQNQPVLETVSYNAATNQTTVTGRLNSAFSNAGFAIEILRAPAAAALPAEGHVVVTTVNTVTDGFRNASFSATFPGLHSDQYFTATATPTGATIVGQGGTSEFADPIYPPTGIFRYSGGGSLSEATPGATRSITVTRSGTYGPATVRLGLTPLATSGTNADWSLNGPVDLAFANGESSKTVLISAVDDLKDEPDTELFQLALSPVSNVQRIADAVVLVSVVDNDAPPVILASPVSVIEGGLAVVPVTLSQPSEKTITVGYDWLNGSANLGSDYGSVVSGTLTFAPGQTSDAFSAQTIDDGLSEGAEDMFFLLFLPTNATVANGSTRVTIIDNDAPPATAFRWYSEPFTTDEAAFLGSAFITIQRTGSLTGAASVRARTVAVSATEADYTPYDQVVEFADGEQFKVIEVKFTNDTMDEPDEAITLVLSEPSAGGLAGLGDPSVLPVTITDNDAPPTLSVDTVVRAEGNNGDVGQVAFTVRLSEPSGFDIPVTAIRPAGSELDVLGFTTMAIPAGTTVSTTAVVAYIYEDRVLEPEETFIISFTSDPFGLATEAKLILTNDDPEVPTIAVFGLPTSVPETMASVPVFLRRYGDVSGTTEVTLGLVSTGTGTVSQKEFTFAPGEEFIPFSLLPEDNLSDEPDRVFTFAVLPKSPAVNEGTGQYSVTLVDNDDPPVLTIDALSEVIEQDAAPVSLTVTFRLSAASGYTVLANNITTTNGTATFPADFQALAVPTLAFPPGQTAISLTISIQGDRIDETDEDFLINILSATNATLGTPSQTVTIIDNDTRLRPYRNWLASRFTTNERRSAALTDPCSDPDLDGLSNGLEFYLDSNPRSSSSGLEKIGITSTGDGRTLFYFTGLIERSTLMSFQVTESDDLMVWKSPYRSTYVIGSISATEESHKVLSHSDQARLFWRIEARCPAFEPEP